MRLNRPMLRAILFVGALLAAAVLPARAAEPERAAGRAEGPVRAPKSHLLLPPGASIVADEANAMPALPPAPGGPLERDPREKVFKLNSVEGRVDGPVTLEAVVDLYRVDGLLEARQKPAFIVVNPPPPAVPP